MSLNPRCSSEGVQKLSPFISSLPRVDSRSQPVSAQPLNVFPPPVRIDSPHNAPPSSINSKANLQYDTGSMEQSKSEVCGNTRPQPAMFPLPPPPPPSGFNLPPPPPFIANNDLGSLAEAQRSAFVNELEDEQDGLRDARDEVLGSRFRLQAQRRELRDLRQESGAKDGSVLSMLRRLLHERDIDLPLHIKNELDEASALRDQLGMVEGEYEEAEMKYNSLEWKYTRKEARFVEGLLDNDFVPSATFIRRKEDYETAELTRFAGEEYETTSDLPLNMLRSTLTERLGPVYSPEAPGSIQGWPHHPKNQDLSSLQRSLSVRSGRSTGSSARRHSDDTQNHARSGWLRKLKYIDEWLRDMISKSPVLKAQLKAFRLLDFWDNESWWQQIETNFHTGDSTASHQEDSQHILSSTKNIMSSDWSEIKTTDTMLLLAEDQNLNALEMQNTPSSIESGDRLEPRAQDEATSIPRQDTKYDANASIFTDTSRSRRTSSTSIAPDITAASGQSCGYLSRKSWSDDPSIVCNGTVGDSVNSINPSERDSGTTPVTPTQRGQNEDYSDTPRLLSEPQGLDVNVLQAQTATSSITHTVSLDQESAYNLIHPVELNMSETDEHHSPLEPCEIPLPPSPQLRPRVSSEAPLSPPIRRRQCPIGPLIRATGANRWFQFELPFPLLRLTSPITCTCSRNDHQIGAQDLPFVSYSDSEIRLPGPYPDDSIF